MESNTTQTGEKTFTQEEVNRIVQERLARAKTEPSEKETEMAAREKAVTERELRLNARDTFMKKGLPVALLDDLDYSDETKMNHTINIIEKVMLSGRKVAGANYSPAGGNNPKSAEQTVDMRIRESMGLK